MFRKLFLVGALCISVVMILGSVALACDANEVYQCKYIGRTRCCGCFVKSSTFCETFLQRANQWCTGDCEARCVVYGGEQGPPGSGDCSGYCDVTYNEDGSIATFTDGCFDPDCEFLVYALCGPKKCEQDPTRKGCWENVSVSSVHFGRDQLNAEVYKKLADCKPGNCKSLLEILGENTDEPICPPGLVLFDAWLGRFNAIVSFCPDGYDESSGECSIGEVVIPAYQEIGQDALDGDYYWSDAPRTVPFQD